VALSPNEEHRRGFFKPTPARSRKIPWDRTTFPIRHNAFPNTSSLVELLNAS